MRYGEKRCLREGTLCAVWRREVFERGDTVCGMEKRGTFERGDTVCGMEKRGTFERGDTVSGMEKRGTFEREDTVCGMEKRGTFEREDTVCGMEKRGVYVASVSLGCAALSRHLHGQCSGVLICGLARPMRRGRWGMALSDDMMREVEPAKFPTSTLGNF